MAVNPLHVMGDYGRHKIRSCPLSPATIVDIEISLFTLGKLRNRMLIGQIGYGENRNFTKLSFPILLQPRRNSWKCIATIVVPIICVILVVIMGWLFTYTQEKNLANQFREEM